jgi:hypothetical protein
MTFLDAADQILKEAGGPLHYREITRRALDRGLIESAGKTPDATMGAQLYMVVKQAAERGEPGSFRQTGRGHFATVSPPTGGTLDVDIQAHNAKVESELLQFLHEMHPRQLELLVGQLLAAIGFESVAVTRYSGDGGIDVDAVLTVGGVTRVKTAIQVKRWKSNVSGSTVRELRGGLMTDQRGLIITTSGFTKDAVIEAAAAGKTPISLIDGGRLIQLLSERQIGVRRKAVSLLELNVAELVAQEEEAGGGERSAVLWPLPGGRERYVPTLLAFLDQVGSQTPTIDQMTKWVLQNFEKVTKQKVVLSYLRSVLYSMGLIEFDGERVVLTEEGELLRKDRTNAAVLRALRANILGVSEILDLLAEAPADTKQIHAHLVSKLELSWETEYQVRFRLDWLDACSAIEKNGKGKWSLAS